MSKTRSIQSIGIIGGGLMGRGIAQVAAVSGFSTILVKASGKGCEETAQTIAKGVARSVQRGKLTEAAADVAMGKLSVVGEKSRLSDVDLVIESVVEDLPIKKALLEELYELVEPKTIFASNTSTLRISDIAPPKALDRTIGLHFFSPVPAMKLVELAHLETTSAEVITQATEWVKSLGKTPVPVLDSTGFIVNRLLVPGLLGAIVAYEQGLAPAHLIDSAMSLGCGHPVGPLLLSDLIGLDIVEKMSELLFAEFKDERFAPPALLKRLVSEGHLGKKSGLGFYDHSSRPAVSNEAVWALIQSQ